MKHLFLFFLFSGSLDSFSQVADTTQSLMQFVDNIRGLPVTSKSLGSMNIQAGTVEWRLPVITPDTLRAICLVTLSPNGLAHARPGFVVISEGKRPVYLDCNKRALKLPQVGWGFKEVNKQ
jgi:hypothetical protein